MAPSAPSQNTDKTAVSDKDAETFAAVFRSLKSEPVVDLEELQKQLATPSKEAARMVWYRLRQKYMPQSVQPKKRKGDGQETGAGEEGENGDGKPKAKSPRKNKVKEVVKAEADVENKE